MSLDLPLRCELAEPEFPFSHTLFLPPRIFNSPLWRELAEPELPFSHTSFLLPRISILASYPCIAAISSLTSVGPWTTRYKHGDWDDDCRRGRARNREHEGSDFGEPEIADKVRGVVQVQVLDRVQLVVVAPSSDRAASS